MTVGRLVLITLLCCVLFGSADATVKEQLQKAAELQQLTFILVLEPKAMNVDAARETIRGAMKEIEKSTLVELDRSDPANAPLVAKYGLAGAPVPLILLVAPNEAVAGGMPAVAATSDALLQMVPSPGKAETLKILQSGKAVFIIASRKNMGAQSDVIKTCAQACQQMKDAAVTVQIDLDDKDEAQFLAQLGIDLNSKEPVTQVLNSQGQTTGTFVGSVDIANLVKNAGQAAAGCCPPGSGKTCEPEKK